MHIISAVFLGGAGVAMLLAAFRRLAAELVARPEGVRVGMFVAAHYPWEDIAGFEIGEPPWAGRDAPGVMLLRDGRRITLRALRETRSSLDPSAEPDVVDDGVRALNRMLAQARCAAASG